MAATSARVGQRTVSQGRSFFLFPPTAAAPLLVSKAAISPPIWHLWRDYGSIFKTPQTRKRIAVLSDQPQKWRKVSLRMWKLTQQLASLLVEIRGVFFYALKKKKEIFFLQLCSIT